MTNSWGNKMRNNKHQWDVAYVLLRQALERYRKVQCYQPILSKYYGLFLKEGITDSEERLLQEISELANSDKTLKVLLSLTEEKCYRKLGYFESEALAESENIRARSVDLILGGGVPVAPPRISPRAATTSIPPVATRECPVQDFLRKYCLPFSFAISSGVFAFGLTHGVGFAPGSPSYLSGSHISGQNTSPTRRTNRSLKDIPPQETCLRQNATYTDPSLEGDATAYDEKLNNAELTVAHPFLPPGSVLSLSNGSKSINVRVNDTIPSPQKSEFSVTWQAASELDMIEEGIEQVSVQSVYINRVETQKLNPAQRASLNAFSQKCSSLIVASVF